MCHQILMTIFDSAQNLFEVGPALLLTHLADVCDQTE